MIRVASSVRPATKIQVRPKVTAGALPEIRQFTRFSLALLLAALAFQTSPAWRFYCVYRGMSDRRDHAHLFRIAVFFGLGLVLFFVARAFLVPKDLGVYGHYRANALEDARPWPIAYAGQVVHVECHGDTGDLRKTGSHAHVACESRHGPLAKHASGDDTTNPVVRLLPPWPDESWKNA